MANVLLVEDDTLQLDVVRTMLERAGHQVSVAENGKDALSQLDLTKPDLVLTDVFMPVLSGVHLALAIRERHGSLPIVAMTGGSGEMLAPYVNSLAEIGIDHVLCKPFSDRELLDACDHVLEDPTA